MIAFAHSLPLLSGMFMYDCLCLLPCHALYNEKHDIQRLNEYDATEYSMGNRVLVTPIQDNMQ